MSKTKITVIIILIFIIIGCLVIYCNNKRQYTESKQYKELINQIDSMNCIVDSLENIQSDLVIQLDSSKNNVQIIEHWYEKEYNVILNQSVDSDCVFFRNYVSNYCK